MASPTNRSVCELRRLLEAAVRAECSFPRPGLWLCIDNIEVAGRLPHSLRIWATLHFTSEGSPFCCGEPMCHLGLYDERLEAVGEHIRRSIGVRHRISVEFADLRPVYHAGIRFHYGDF